MHEKANRNKFCCVCGIMSGRIIDVTTGDQEAVRSWSRVFLLSKISVRYESHLAVLYCDFNVSSWHIEKGFVSNYQKMGSQHT